MSIRVLGPLPRLLHCFGRHSKTIELDFSNYMFLNKGNMASYSRTYSPGTEIRPQLFDYFLVLDFEATCEQNQKISPQEIIEFPVLKVNGNTFDVEAEFHQYVEPQIHPELSTFCTELTGIVQDMVTGQPSLDTTIKNFQQWLDNERLLSEGTHITFVTCGDWDLRTMLPGQAQYFNLKYPGCMKRWINIKKSYANVMDGHYPKGMKDMLKGLSLKHQGRHHSGIDDCRNIANILKALACRGYVFENTAILR